MPDGIHSCIPTCILPSSKKLHACMHTVYMPICLSNTCMFITIGYQAAHEVTLEPEYDYPGNSSPTNRIEQKFNLSPTVNMNENMAYGHLNSTDHVDTNVNVAYGHLNSTDHVDTNVNVAYGHLNSTDHVDTNVNVAYGHLNSTDHVDTNVNVAYGHINSTDHVDTNVNVAYGHVALHDNQDFSYDNNRDQS